MEVLIKKSNLLILTTLLIGFTASAESLDCKITASLTAKSGLIPSQQSAEIKTLVLDDIKSPDDLKKCGSAQIEGLKIKLCVLNHQVIGLYTVLVLPEKSFQDIRAIDDAILGQLTMGISRESRTQELMAIDGSMHMVSSLKKILENAKIEFNSETKGDSVSIDQAIVEGHHKGIVQSGLPALVEVDTCHLVK
ncbi:MAG: hypothetical protein H7328_08300 [Bdellovibrio sp.]|nr:hypothetical protein [Bdellovibrio sp.]